MKENKMELLLHPIRFQLVQEFMGGEKLTAKHLAEKLPHIPQATLYRHLDKLMSSQILLVVEEKQIRGTIEKLYVLNGSMARMSQKWYKGFDERRAYAIFYDVYYWAYS